MPDCTNREFKDAIYEQFARMGKALAHPSRLVLLELLLQADRTVETLAGEAGLSVASTSQHLQALKAARLVETEKRGLYVTYRIADPLVQNLLCTIRALAERRLAEVEQMTRQFMEGRAGMEPVDGAGLLERVKQGEATVLDVRPAEEFRAGHLPGAVSIPLRELEQRLAELPRDREIVAYCRGPYCVLAIQAVELLRSKGLPAMRLEESVHDWEARGVLLAVGEE
jgi:rhodanese-related sulfurtransferase/DNA-binding transcriptional ArsR family regulator